MTAVQTEAIGRYRVIGTLGQGAMGRVYLAYDPGLDMKVAIKLIRRDDMRENQVILARFRREAALGARMRNPGIVAILDVGVDAQHGPFLVMEHVDGRELLEILREGGAEPGQKLVWLHQIAGALACAHAAGVVHRDVKPANILVSRDGRAKLIDFGVAKVLPGPVPASRGPIAEDPDLELLDERHATAWGLLSAHLPSGGEDALEVLRPVPPPEAPPAGDPRRSDALTQMGALIGTPCFTAPELLQGALPSPRTDHFAFAVTAFQTLLGHLPFRGPQALAGIREGRIAFPEDASPELRAVFRRALDPDPEARYPDLEAFLSELHGVLGVAPPVPDAPRPGARRVFRRLRTRLLPWLRLLGGAAAVLLLTFFGLQHWLASRTGLTEISVQTLPRGASVYVDGHFLGRTPLERAPLPPKARQIRVEKARHAPVERPRGTPPGTAGPHHQHDPGTTALRPGRGEYPTGGHAASGRPGGWPDSGSPGEPAWPGQPRPGTAP